MVADLFLGLVGRVSGEWLFARVGFYSSGYIGSLAAATVGVVLLVTMARLLAGTRVR